MASYEPDIVEQFADRLYKQAADIISRNVFGGVIVGIFAGIATGFGIAVVDNLMTKPPGAQFDAGAAMFKCVVAMVLLTVIGGVSGYYYGKEKAFELRLKAQQALCQLQIEKNTLQIEKNTRKSA
jgi:hypothetical protein